MTHGARYSKRTVLPVLERLLDTVSGVVLDPMAGVGGIHDLARPDLRTIGVELEPNFVTHARLLHPEAETVCGDARLIRGYLDALDVEHVDAVCVSPAYGNRFTDGYRPTADCASYAQWNGGPLLDGNGGSLRWFPTGDRRGDEYRSLHAACWKATVDVLRPGGMWILNVSDFYRQLVPKGPSHRMDVVRWHVETLQALGLDLCTYERVGTQRRTRGENRHRVAYEVVASFTKPTREELVRYSTTRAARRDAETHPENQ